MTRYELAQAIAIMRVEYERDTRAAGYSDRHFQPLVPFCIEATKTIVQRGDRVAGVTYHAAAHLFEIDVDFRRLAKRVERQLPMWRQTAHALAVEAAIVTSPPIGEVVAA